MTKKVTHITKILITLTVLGLTGFMAVCKRTDVRNSNSRAAGEIKEVWTNEPIQPIPIHINLDADKVALGEKLFNEVQLSRDNTVSCATCHSMDLGGTDQLPRSKGIDGQLGAVNAPTVFNAAYNFKQFWDGRAETLESQIDGPTHAADEMGSNWEEIERKLRHSEEYTAEFARVYKDDIHTENIKDAIAAFERSLLTPNSRFDRFLKGDGDAITKEEKDGYRVFKSVGCVSCHQGMNAGGNLFQEFGVMGDYFNDRGNITKADLGRYNVTHNDLDRHVFKVPGLRNVSRTFPYFHDGSALTLENAVGVMSKYQLGRQLSPQEVDSIVLFLKTLDGEYTRYGSL
ncbi:MAG TPA: cytochrome c peroxidase [Pyrinomonadaceae bacterium]|nr:cytochrome c peroxidase [Pyrinomonadaceae bacterium]